MSGNHTIELVAPLDYLIMAELPKQGTLLGGIQPLASTVYILRERIGDGTLPPDTISGRLKSLRLLGYVVDVPIIPANRGRGWQVTQAGLDALTTWKESTDASG